MEVYKKYLAVYKQYLVVYKFNLVDKHVADVAPFELLIILFSNREWMKVE